MSTSTVDIGRGPIIFLYESTCMVDIDQFLGTIDRTDGRYRPSISTVILRRWNQTDRRYRPCSPVGGTDRRYRLDKPTGRLKPTDRTDENSFFPVLIWH